MKNYYKNLFFMITLIFTLVSLTSCIKVDPNLPDLDPKIYTIHYELDGGINHELNPDKYLENSSPIFLQEPTRVGYEFVNWHLDSLDGKVFNVIERGTNRNITLYAEWFSVDNLNIVQEIETPVTYKESYVTWTITNNSECDYNDYLAIRFQGSNLDKALVLSNATINSKATTLEEVYNEETFIGYDANISVKSGETIKVKALATASRLGEYKFKTLTDNSTSSTACLNVIEKLDITESISNDADGVHLNIKVVNNGCSYSGVLAIRFQGSNLDNALELSNLLVDGKEEALTKVNAEDGSFLGYDVNITVDSAKEVNLSALVTTKAAKTYLIKSLTENATSSTYSYVKHEDLVLKHSLSKASTADSSIYTLNVKNGSTSFDGYVGIRFNGTNDSKHVILEDILVNGNKATVKEVYDGESFVGYDVLVSLKPNEEVEIKATVKSSLCGSYQIVAVSLSNESTKLDLSFTDTLEILQDVNNRDLTITVNNNGIRYNDYIFIRTQGTNKDNSFKLSNILVNGKKATVKEKIESGELLGYDVLVDASTEAIITAKVSSIANRSYTLKTLSSNSTSASYSFTVKEALGFKQEVTGMNYKATITNNGVTYNGKLTLSFTEEATINEISFTSFTLDGKKIEATPLYNKERLVGYTFDISILEGKEIILTAKVNAPANRSYNISLASINSISEEYNLLTAKEALAISNEITLSKYTIDIVNNGLRYNGKLFIKFSDTNNDLSLSLANPSISLEELKENDKFIGYSFDVDILEGKSLHLEFTVTANTVKTYKVNAESINCYSDVKELQVTEKLEITNERIDNTLKVTVKNLGAKYHGYISINFQGTNTDKSLELTSFLVNGKATSAKEHIVDGKLIGYDLDITCLINDTIEITATLNPTICKEYSVKTLTDYQTSSTYSFEIKEELVLIQRVIDGEYIITITNNGKLYTNGIKVTFNQAVNYKIFDLSSFTLDDQVITPNVIFDEASGIIKAIEFDFDVLEGKAYTIKASMTEVANSSFQAKINSKNVKGMTLSYNSGKEELTFASSYLDKVITVNASLAKNYQTYFGDIFFTLDELNVNDGLTLKEAYINGSKVKLEEVKNNNILVGYKLANVMINDGDVITYIVDTYKVKEYSFTISSKNSTSSKETINITSLIEGVTLGKTPEYIYVGDTIDLPINESNPTKLYTISVTVNDPTLLKYDTIFTALEAGATTVNIKVSTNCEEKVLSFDLTIYKTSYNISYNLDGGVNNESNKATFDPRVGASLLDPSKVGYIFTGWVDELGNPVTKIDPLTHKDVKLKATWSIVKYSITYITNDGIIEGTPKEEYTILDEVSLPVISKVGYNFIGWYNSESKVESIAKGTHENLTLTAKFEAISYAISYDVAGGVLPEGLKTSYTILDEVTLLPATKLGYKFLGWYSESNLVEKINKGTTGEVSLTAKWEIVTYTITFDPAGGILDPLTVTYTVLDTVTLPEPTKTGYAFLGWFNGDTQASDITAGSTGDLNLTARWEANVYNINYDLAGGQFSTLKEDVIIDGDPIHTLKTTHNSNYWGNYTKAIFLVKSDPKAPWTYRWILRPVKNNLYEIVDFIKGSTETIPVQPGDLVMYVHDDSSLLSTTNEIRNSNSIGLKVVVTGDINTGVCDIAVYGSTQAYLGDVYTPFEIKDTYTVEELPLTLPTPIKKNNIFLGWYNGDQKLTEIAANTIDEINLVAHWDNQERTIKYNYDLGHARAHKARSFNEVIDYFFESFYAWSGSTENFNAFKQRHIATWKASKQTEYWLYKNNGRDTTDDRYFIHATSTRDEWIPWLDAIEKLTNNINPSQHAYNAAWLGLKRFGEYLSGMRLTDDRNQYFVDAVQVREKLPTTYILGDSFDLVPLEADPAHQFLGWFDENGNQVDKITAEMNSNLVLTAKWKEIRYNVSYDLNGGHWPLMYQSHAEMVADFVKDFNKQSGKTVAADGSDFNARTWANGQSLGYKFLTDPAYAGKWGWMLDLINDDRVARGAKPLSESDNQAEARGEIHTLLNLCDTSTTKGFGTDRSGLTFEAYSVVYLAIKGPSSYLPGNNVTITAPIKQGFTFKGWLTSDGKLINNITEDLRGDLVLTAQWETQGYNITLNLNGGSLTYASRDALVSDFVKDYNELCTHTYASAANIPDNPWGNIDFHAMFEGTLSNGISCRDKWIWLAEYLLEISKANLDPQNSSVTGLTKLINKQPYKDGIDTYGISYAFRAFLKGTIIREGHVGHGTADFRIYENANGFWTKLSAHESGTIVLQKGSTLPIAYKEGKTFVGWFDNAEGTGEPITVLSDGLVLYAKFA